MSATHEEKSLDLTNPLKIAEAVQNNGGKPVTVQLYYLNGIFGELNGCNGIAEDVINSAEKMAKWGLDPEEGGTYIKLIGCSYLYKGDPAEQRVFGMEQAKSMISTVPRDIIGKSVLYSLAGLLRFIFQRKKFIHDVHVYFNEIKHKTMRHVSPPDIRLARFTREIRRAMDVALKQEFGIPAERDLFNDTPIEQVFGTILDFCGAVVKAVAFFTLMFELDGAYRFPMQDMFGELDKKNAQRSGAREMLRLAQLMINRNTNLTPLEGISDRTEGVPNKFRFMKKLLWLVYIFSPLARRITQRFLLELKVEKVALDEADWYFCLRRNTHNYRGIPFPDRMDELERIDKEKGHQYVKIEFQRQIANAPNAPSAQVTLEPPKL